MNHLPPTRRACWWTQHPPLPAQPTHMRCRYSWVHLVLHGCLHSTDAALLDQQRAFLRYDLPSKLSDVWLCVSAAMDLDTPMVHTGKLIKVVLEAAKLCESDPRLLLSLADTAEAQDAPVNGLVASRWQLVITTRALVHKPEDSLFHEAWLLWRCRDRFTRAARAADVSPFRILSESARLKVDSESALLAPFLAVAARNFGTIATQVTAEMKSWTIPLEMLEFPDDPFLVLKDASQLQRYLSGTDAERQAAFVARLDTVLVHYSAIHLQHNGTNLDNGSDMEVNGLTLVEPMAEAPAAKKRKTGSALSSVSRFGRTVSLCSHLHSLARPTCRYPVPQPALDTLHQTL
jgi:hypothetical protein